MVMTACSNAVRNMNHKPRRKKASKTKDEEIDSEMDFKADDLDETMDFGVDQPEEKPELLDDEHDSTEDRSTSVSSTNEIQTGVSEENPSGDHPNSNDGEIVEMSTAASPTVISTSQTSDPITVDSVQTYQHDISEVVEANAVSSTDGQETVPAQHPLDENSLSDDTIPTTEPELEPVADSCPLPPEPQYQAQEAVRNSTVDVPTTETSAIVPKHMAYVKQQGNQQPNTGEKTIIGLDA